MGTLRNATTECGVFRFVLLEQASGGHLVARLIYDCSDICLYLLVFLHMYLCICTDSPSRSKLEASSCRWCGLGAAFRGGSDRLAENA